MGGSRVVAVGQTLYHSDKWKTFEDFLFAYLKSKLGAEWGNSELAKPPSERHPVFQWQDEVARLQLDHVSLPGEVTSAPTTGAVICYLGLAYNLYLLEHNVELQERYLNRLRDLGNFQGAYYELIVANVLIRSGFTLALEDEADLSSKHCEFAAVSRTTGKKYWVEAKMRSVAGLFGKTALDGVSASERDATCNLTAHIKAALQKPADGERLIFVDLNAEAKSVDGVPDWGPTAIRRLEAKERDLQEGQCAYVFVTNLPFHRYLSSTELDRQALAYGLGIPDFSKPKRRSLTEIYKLTMKHIDAHEIMEGLQSYPVFPDTFDGELRSDKLGLNVKIGETYLFEGLEGEPGTVGTVTSATVVKEDAEAMVAISTPDGRSLIVKQPLTPEQMADYQRHPTFFFGQEEQNGGNIEDPYLLFEWMHKTYSKTSKERLLEFMSQAPNIEILRGLPQDELALIYCEGLVGNFLAQYAPEKLDQPSEDVFKRKRKSAIKFSP